MDQKDKDYLNQIVYAIEKIHILNCRKNLELKVIPEGEESPDYHLLCATSARRFDEVNNHLKAVWNTGLIKKLQPEIKKEPRFLEAYQTITDFLITFNTQPQETHVEQHSYK